MSILNNSECCWNKQQSGIFIQKKEIQFSRFYKDTGSTTSTALKKNYLTRENLLCIFQKFRQYVLSVDPFWRQQFHSPIAENNALYSASFLINHPTKGIFTSHHTNNMPLLLWCFSTIGYQKNWECTWVTSSHPINWCKLAIIAFNLCAKKIGHQLWH